MDVISFDYQPQLLITFAYLVLISGVLIVKLITPLNRLLEYGKNTQLVANASSAPTTPLVSVIADKLVVPKSWFTHFYICLFTLSTASYFRACHDKLVPGESASYKNASIIQGLLVLQGGRRMAESFLVTKFSPTSKMNFSHYAVGLSHYVLIAMATYFGVNEFCATSATFTIMDYLLMAMFGASSYQQFSVHYHLANLHKYSLPSFQTVASPHYMWEVALYSVLLIFSVKDGVTPMTWSFLAAWVFVVVNLSITSIETYKYYKSKYPDEFRLKWAIIPGIL
ncbi:uncharacterized protein LODBEIA_P36400 [Lodderomyces beijingensis]|uniref:Polyprenal reductase n=1 Tax=Lodderomyces beijingensis TaxID=1775926 RepID=A0ABP0ZMN0_9ASCO